MASSLRRIKTVAAPLLVLLLVAVGCSGGDSGSGGSGETAKTSGSPDATLTTAGESGSKEPGTTVPEGTLGEEPSRPDVVLRVEGDPKVRFSGICAVGSHENVISGRVSKRYEFDLGDQELSCEIRKRDPGGGNLKTTLIAGNDTRSVQAVNTQGGRIRVTYSHR